MIDGAWASVTVKTAFPYGTVKQRKGTALDWMMEWARQRQIKGWPTVRRVRAYFEGDTSISLKAHEKEALEAALAAREQAKAYDQARTTVQHLQSLRAALEAQDADFHADQINALRGVELLVRGQMRGSELSGDEGEE